MGLGVYGLMLTVIPSFFHIVVNSISISSFNGILDFAILVRGGIRNVGSIDRVDPGNSMRPVHGSGQVQGLGWIMKLTWSHLQGTNSPSATQTRISKHKFKCKVKSKATCMVTDRGNDKLRSRAKALPPHCLTCFFLRSRSLLNAVYLSFTIFIERLL
jgi:hypothetical protein